MGVLSTTGAAFVFPGQGSQHVGMGRDLFECFPAARDVFDRADSELGFSISGLCFDGPEEELRRTVNTQPALYAVSCAAVEVARERGTEPVVAAGHSVGEYAALYAAGAFGFEDGLRLVRTRAELMQRAAERHPGTMAAVLGLSPEQVAEAVQRASEAGVVSAANFNSPIQTVISGEPEAVERASQIAGEMGAKRVVALNVSGAFHSPLMQEAADALRDALEEVDIADARVPVAANFTGKLESRADEIRANLALQITGSVKWVDCVGSVLEAGAKAFVELGPGNVLAGLIKRIAPEVKVYPAGDRASFDALIGPVAQH